MVEINFVALVIRFVLVFEHVHGQIKQLRIVHGVLRHVQRIAGQHVVLHTGYVALYARREGEHYRHADYAYRPGNAHHDGAPFLCDEVAAGQSERRGKPHFRALFALLFTAVGSGFRRFLFGADATLRLLFLVGIRIGIVYHLSVEQADDTRGILLRELGVVRDHDDEPLAGDLLHQIHYLHARLGVERAGGFVGKQYFGVVDKGAGNRDALALPAGKLIGAFVQMLAQTHFFQHRFGACAAFGFAHTGNGKRKFDVAEHRLMRNEVITLEHEADAMVAVYVPFAVAERFGGAAVYDEVAGRIFIQSADDIEQRGFSAAARAEDGHELVRAEIDADAFERRNVLPRNLVIFSDVGKS